jgi:predicted metalloprotease
MPAADLRRSSSHVRAGRVLVLVVAALAVAGCTIVTPGREDPSPERRTGSPARTASAPEASAASNEAGRELQRRPEILEDLKGAVSTVKQYWAAEFQQSGRTFTPVRRVYAYVPGDGTSCGGEPNVPGNAAYCRPNDDIGFDVRWTSQAYDALGDAFVYYLIGHEYAHAVQQRLGVAFSHTIEYELQADCYAGAYLGDQTRAGALTLEDGDIDELRNGLRAVADPEGTPWFDPQAHGTADQRIDYFARGFDESLSACP